jgi:hypothetical protein
MQDYVKAMRTILLSAAIVLAGASGAGAACVSYPDNASSYNVENNTAQALCLQQELALDTSRAAQQAQIDAMIGNMRIEAERQQQMVYDRLNQSLFNTPPF